MSYFLHSVVSAQNILVLNSSNENYSIMLSSSSAKQLLSFRNLWVTFELLLTEVSDNDEPLHKACLGNKLFFTPESVRGTLVPIIQHFHAVFILVFKSEQRIA